MNIKNFVNLFNEMPPAIGIVMASTYPAGINDLGFDIRLVKAYERNCSRKYGFAPESNIHSITMTNDGLVMVIDSFHKESIVVRLGDIIDVLHGDVKLKICYYDIDLIVRNGQLPRYLKENPNLLNRQVMNIEWIDAKTLGIRLDYDFDSLFEDCYYEEN